MNEVPSSLLKPGDVFTHAFSFSQDGVNQFAEVTGDTNPLHSDHEYAAKTIFKKPIMHGFLGGSIFSKVFGTMFPGEGTIYLKQNMQFMKPMYVDKNYEAVFTVKSVIPEKHKAIIETRIVEKDSNDVTIEGEAEVMNRHKI